MQVKDTGEVWSDHWGFEGRWRVVSFLKHYGNNVISNVPLSFHLWKRKDEGVRRTSSAVPLSGDIKIQYLLAWNEQTCSQCYSFNYLSALFALMRQNDFMIAQSVLNLNNLEMVICFKAKFKSTFPHQSGGGKNKSALFSPQTQCRSETNTSLIKWSMIAASSFLLPTSLSFQIFRGDPDTSVYESHRSICRKMHRKWHTLAFLDIPQLFLPLFSSLFSAAKSQRLGLMWLMGN